MFGDATGNCNRTGARCEKHSSQFPVHDIVTAQAALGYNQLLVSSRELETSRRRELGTDNYAAHTSHPFCCSSSRSSHPFSCSYPLTCTCSISVLRLLSPQTTKIPLQLRRPPLRVIAETLCPRARPQFSCLALGLAGAICVALIDPIALRL